MKKLFLFIAFAFVLFTETFAQTPISALPTITTDVTGGWVPVVVGTTTRKTDAKNLGNLDSVSVASGSTYDTLKVFKNGVQKYYKLIRAGSSFDTTAVYAAIGLKLSKSDTASMLSPYIRSNVAAATYQPIGSYATTSQVTGVQSNLDTTRTGIRADLNGKQGALTLTTTGSSGAATLTGNTLNIPQYSGGGGGSADSSWVSSETGVAPNVLGILANHLSFPSLPTGWSTTAPNATVTISGNKIAVSGGNPNTQSIAGEGTGSSYTNRIETDSAHNYGIMYYRFRVVPQSKTSTSKLSFTFYPNAFLYSASTDFRLSFSDNADSSGILYVSSIGSSAVTAKTRPLQWSVGDTLEVLIRIDNWNVGVIYKNIATSGVVTTSFSVASPLGSGGKAIFGLTGGSQHITLYQAYSYQALEANGFILLGDSQFAGNGATGFDKSYFGLLNRGMTNRNVNISNNSTTLEKMARWSVPNAIKLPQQYVIIGGGYNDRRDLVTDTNTYRQRLDTVAYRLMRAGKTVVLATLVPQSGVSNNFNIAIRNLATSRGLRTIPIDSVVTLRANMLSSDAIHWSDSAQYLAYVRTLERVPELEYVFKGDSTSNITYNNLPTGNENMERLVIDGYGKVFKTPRTTYNSILNAYNNNGRGTIAQAGSEIHVSSTIKTDSALFVHNRNGLYIGFNGGQTSDTTRTGTNIVITNAGIGGTGYPQVFGTYNENGLNVVIQQQSKTLRSAGNMTVLGGNNWIHTYSSANISGSGNYVSQSARGLALTLGSNNSLNGLEGGGSFTTANYNYSWTNLINYNGTSNNPAWAANNAVGTMMWGTPYDYNGGSLMQNGEVLIASYTRGDRLYTFGPRGGFSGTKTTWWPGHQAGTNLNGLPLYISAMPQTGNGVTGKIILQSYNGGGSSGTTVATSTSDELEVDNKKVLIPNRFQTSTGANVASANDLTLGNDGNVFTITGTTQINAITTTNWQAGSEITLVFAASVTVKHNTSGGANTALLKLNGATDFSATADDVLTLIYTGSAWVEKSRSVN